MKDCSSGAEKLLSILSLKRSDLLYWVKRRRARRHEAHIHFQFVYYKLALLEIVSHVVITDDNTIPQIILRSMMLDKVDETFNAVGFS